MRVRRRFGVRRTKSHLWTRAQTAAGLGAPTAVLGINLIDPADFAPIPGLDSNRGLLYKGGHALFVPHYNVIAFATEGIFRVVWGVYVGYEGAPTRDPRQTAAADQEADWLQVGYLTQRVTVAGDYVPSNQTGGLGEHVRIKTKRRIQTNQQIVFSFVAQVDSGAFTLSAVGGSGFNLIDSELVQLRGL